MKTPKHDMAVAARFKEFRLKHISKNSIEAGKLLEIPQSRISRIENGEQPLTVELTKQMIKKFGLNRDWLIDNTGNMIKSDRSKKTGLETSIQMGDRIDALNTKIRLLEANLNHAHSVIDIINKRLDRLEQNK